MGWMMARRLRIGIGFRMGLVLLAQGWITHPQLQMALDGQRKTGQGRIGDWLAQTCALDHLRVTRALGMQWNCPVFTTDGFAPSTMALVMPKRFITEFGVVPLRMVWTAAAISGF